MVKLKYTRIGPVKLERIRLRNLIISTLSVTWSSVAGPNGRSMCLILAVQKRGLRK